MGFIDDQADVYTSMEELSREAYAEFRSMPHVDGCTCAIRSGVEDRLEFEDFPEQRFVPVGELIPCSACLALKDR